MTPFSPEEDARLRTALKRCSPACLEAARAFRKSGSAEFLPPLVYGIIERYMEPGLRPRLAPSSHSLRLIEDLGIDSLTLMEIVMLAEEVLQISIDNDELRPLRTVGDVQRFLAGAVRPVSAAGAAPAWPRGSDLAAASS